MRIVCEIGSNWKTLEDCFTSIRLAKNCGADAVKFQLFNDLSLYGFEKSNPYSLTEPCYDLLHGMAELESQKSFERNRNKCALDPEWLPLLKQECDHVGIEFMCTAFSPELVDAVDPYVKTHKVASAELTHKRLLERIASKGKPVYLSTGASGMADIAEAIKILKPVPVTILYCEAAYPARYVNFAKLHELRKVFGPDYAYGYSDHSTDVAIIPSLAKANCATVIEKHVNLVGVTDTPDAPHSLSIDEFKIMVRAIRGEDIGHPNFEKDMYTTHNRRLIAIRDIKVGDVFRENENFGIFRALRPDTSALSPWLIDRVNSQMSKIEIKCGEGIPPQAIL